MKLWQEELSKEGIEDWSRRTKPSASIFDPAFLLIANRTLKWMMIPPFSEDCWALVQWWVKINNARNVRRLTRDGSLTDCAYTEEQGLVSAPYFFSFSFGLLNGCVCIYGVWDFSWRKRYVFTWLTLQCLQV